MCTEVEKWRLLWVSKDHKNLSIPEIESKRRTCCLIRSVKYNTWKHFMLYMETYINKRMYFSITSSEKENNYTHRHIQTWSHNLTVNLRCLGRGLWEHFPKLFHPSSLLFLHYSDWLHESWITINRRCECDTQETLFYLLGSCWTF